MSLVQLSSGWTPGLRRWSSCRCDEHLVSHMGWRSLHRSCHQCSLGKILLHKWSCIVARSRDWTQASVKEGKHGHNFNHFGTSTVMTWWSACLFVMCTRNMRWLNVIATDPKNNHALQNLIYNRTFLVSFSPGRGSWNTLTFSRIWLHHLWYWKEDLLGWVLPFSHRRHWWQTD